MTRRNDGILSTAEVDRLATLVEEAARATRGAPKRFVEPARGTLDRAKSKRHHIVFGRRGSGKTSMLQKALNDLSLDRRPASFVDLEAFKQHSYPDVLLSVLIASFRDYSKWFEQVALNPSNKTSFWQRFFGARPTRPPLSKKHVETLRQKLQTNIADLESLLYSTDASELVQTQRRCSEQEARAGASAGITVPAMGIGADAAISEKQQVSNEIIERSKKSKIDYLHRHIIEYQSLVDEIIATGQGDVYCVLDDLYHLRKDDQVHVVDYFHRIAKGRSFWLKIGTIRHRTEWYRHGQPPLGMKLGDDCDEIDLDITLEKYELAREFLFKILNQLVTEAGLPSYRSLLADGAVNRLVLTICRKSIDHARERGINQRGEKIGAEDVNAAAGEHDSTKREELRRDTHGERPMLEKALTSVQDFCLGNKVNCFLVERDRDTPGQWLINELLDLRFLHLASSRQTVRDEQGKLFSCYLLDVSQYTGARKRRELDLVEFWTREGIDRLRRSKYVLDSAKLVDARPGGEAAPRSE